MGTETEKQKKFQKMIHCNIQTSFLFNDTMERPPDITRCSELHFISCYTDNQYLLYPRLAKY
jgi:hypothetical protein